MSECGVRNIHPMFHPRPICPKKKVGREEEEEEE
jgi:hypothetical protein